MYIAYIWTYTNIDYKYIYIYIVINICMYIMAEQYLAPEK